jgi:hypothetical protein
MAAPAVEVGRREGLGLCRPVRTGGGIGGVSRYVEYRKNYRNHVARIPVSVGGLSFICTLHIFNLQANALMASDSVTNESMNVSRD